MPEDVRQPLPQDKIRAQWKRWIMMQLGAPVIKVELTEAQVDESIDSAIKIFSQWGYEMENKVYFVTEPRKAAYELDKIVPNWIDIRDVVYSPSQADSLLQGFFTDFSFDSRSFFWYHSTYASMTDYTILNMYNEMYLRTIGNEGQWEVVGKEVQLSPTPDKQVLVQITYVGFPEDGDIRRDEWLRSWALSECKMMLGRIRGKYDNMPGPQGANLSLDGKELIQEAREDQKELRERLNEYIMPAMFETG